MKPFARIPVAIPRSGIREIMDLAWAVEKTGEVIHLEVGQPDFATPEPIVEATCRYARAGHTKYVPNAGVDALRAAAARHFERRTGVPTTSENILVTPGAVMSVATSFLALLEPGDEVLLPDPGWPNYEMAVSIVHGRPIFYNLRAENHFLPDLDEIDRLVSPRTKLLLLCTPSNPTGQVYDEALMRQLMDLAQRHDLWVLSDEIYGQIVFDQPHQSALPHDADGRAIVVSGMSKSYAMTGYRVGFTRANPEYIELASKLQEPFISCGTGLFPASVGRRARRPARRRGRHVPRLCAPPRHRPRCPARTRLVPLHPRRRDLPDDRHLRGWHGLQRIRRPAAQRKARGRGSGQHLRPDVPRPRAHLHRRLRRAHPPRRDHHLRIRPTDVGGGLQTAPTH